MRFFIRKDRTILSVPKARVTFLPAALTSSVCQCARFSRGLSTGLINEPNSSRIKPGGRWTARRRTTLLGLCALLSSCSGDQAPETSATAARSAQADLARSASVQDRRHALLETRVVNNPVPLGQAGEGPNDRAALARSAPVGIAVDTAGNLYIMQRDKSVREITPQGRVSLHASGAARGATRPADSLIVATDEAGNIHVVDKENCSIRRITPTGTVTTTTLPTSPVGAACSAMQAPTGAVRNAAPLGR